MTVISETVETEVVVIAAMTAMTGTGEVEAVGTTVTENVIAIGKPEVPEISEIAESHGGMVVIGNVTGTTERMTGRTTGEITAIEAAGMTVAGSAGAIGLETAKETGLVVELVAKANRGVTGDRFARLNAR